MHFCSYTYVHVIGPAHHTLLHFKNLTIFGDRDQARVSSFVFFCIMFFLPFFRVQIQSSSPYPRTPSVLCLSCNVTTLSHIHRRLWKKDMCTFQALHSKTEKRKQKILDQILRDMYSLNLIFYWYLHLSNVPFFYCRSQWENITRIFMVASSSSAYNCHEVGQLVDPFPFHVFRSLFNYLPWFMVV
jgi:hypothetical protein